MKKLFFLLILPLVLLAGCTASAPTTLQTQSCEKVARPTLPLENLPETATKQEIIDSSVLTLEILQEYSRALESVIECHESRRP